MSLVTESAAVHPSEWGKKTKSMIWVDREREQAFRDLLGGYGPALRRVAATYEADLLRFLGWVAGVAFTELGLHRIFTETWATRTSHIAILERFGFVLEGRMRDHVVKDGEVVDALIHGLLDTDRVAP